MDMDKGMENLNTESIMNDAALAVKSSTDGMQKWSEEKRKDFCEVFDQRARCSAFILTCTASELLDTANRRQFVGQKAKAKLQNEFAALLGYQAFHGKGDDYQKLGGRNIEELKNIAAGRAKEIFENLPPLKQAVQLIKPEVAKKIDQFEAFKNLAQKYADELDKPEYTKGFNLSQVDQDMTIGEFRQMLKDRIEKRTKLVKKLNEVAKAAVEIEDVIAKELYAGIPELQEAIIDVARKHYERAAAMGGMQRRVIEHVQFGDSEAAIAMVKQFEKDEQVVSPTIKAEFDAALNKLKLSAPLVKKAYLAAKKEKKS